MTGTTGTAGTMVRTGCRPSSVATRLGQADRRARFGRLVAVAAAVLVPSALIVPTVRAHHFTGEVQLWASTVEFRDSPGGVLVTVRLVERESGESVSGFGVAVTATGGGERVGPIELQESEFAVYSGALALSPGEWEILVRTHQGNSSLPAIESAHRRALEIDASGRLVAPADEGSAAAITLAIVLPIGAVVVLLFVVLRRRRLTLGDAAEVGDASTAGDAGAPTTDDDPVAGRDSR